MYLRKDSGANVMAISNVRHASSFRPSCPSEAANRILASGGVALHHIDPSDHLSHGDPSILPINFLRFSDDEWHRIAGNQFAYHNRLRATEYARLYEDSQHEVLIWKPHVDEASLRAVENGFPLDPKFREYSPEVLSTLVLQVVSRPSR